MKIEEENRDEKDNLVIQGSNIPVEPINHDNLFQGNPSEEP